MWKFLRSDYEKQIRRIVRPDEITHTTSNLTIHSLLNYLEKLGHDLRHRNQQLLEKMFIKVNNFRYESFSC